MTDWSNHGPLFHHSLLFTVIPAKAGIPLSTFFSGMPAFAGMTAIKKLTAINNGTHGSKKTRARLQERQFPSPTVIPAQAGIQLITGALRESWIPAFAGMTVGNKRNDGGKQ